MTNEKGISMFLLNQGLAALHFVAWLGMVLSLLGEDKVTNPTSFGIFLLTAFVLCIANAVSFIFTKK